MRSSRQLEAVSRVQLIIGAVAVSVSDTVRDLGIGITLDAQRLMKNTKHVLN